jgi:hypothetical protein
MIQGGKEPQGGYGRPRIGESSNAGSSLSDKLTEIQDS